MATWIARDCGCKQEAVMGRKREKFCEPHGNLFESEATIESRNNRRSSPIRRSAEPKRDWTDARAKVEHEHCCRICKKSEASGRPLEAAHVLGREHDQPKVSRTTGEILKELYVDPNRIIPACGPFPAGCHGDVDHRRINILQFLTLDEQIQAVKDAGGIEAARIRLEPVTHREEVEASSATAIQGAVG
jgi:hypothetical protein